MQTQIRRRRMHAASDQGLHRLLTGNSIKNNIKIEKCTRHSEKNRGIFRNGHVQLIGMEKSSRQIWVSGTQGEVLIIILNFPTYPILTSLSMSK